MVWVTITKSNCLTDTRTNKSNQVWYAGQAMGLINDIPTCQQLLRRIESEAIDALRKSETLYTEPPAQSKI
jgi:NAD(P)H-dependent flavin oxidoreductase YrpB (nitropropane dioxygenase family)